MATDVRIGENAGKSEAQVKELNEFLIAMRVSRQFVRPYHEKAVRMFRLYAGHPPPEIAGTFSQVMLWFPYSIIENELPLFMNYQMQGDWLNLTATSPELELTATTAMKWAKYQMETQQKFAKTVIPTIQSTDIFGNGYRFYGHRFIDQVVKEEVDNTIEMGMLNPEQPTRTVERTVKKGVITGEYINYFNVLPSPSGGFINPQKGTFENGLDWLIVYMYPDKKLIENEVKRGNFDKNQAAQLFANVKGFNPATDPSYEYKQDLVKEDGAWTNFNSPEWVTQMDANNGNLPSRYRIAFFFRRDKWMIVAEDKYILYSGKPLYDFWPLANFKSSFCLDNFFGTGLLETVEDLLLSMILNFNMRMDYLAFKFHPMKYLPQKLIDDVGGDLSAFDPEPYKTVAYEHTLFSGGLDKYMISDVQPELTQQAFLEQGQMEEYMQGIIGQHDSGAVSGNTATVGASLISKDVARAMYRLIAKDQTGVTDSVEMTMKLGAKFVNEDETIRTGADGLPWEDIDHKAITDGYGVSIDGARSMLRAEETFKRQLSLAPMFLNNPAIQGQMELSRQLLETGKFKNVDTILDGTGESAPIRGPEQKLPGGIPSEQGQAAGLEGSQSAVGVGAV